MPSNTDSSAVTASVIVVGAGPVGLFNALLLAQAGVDVAVLEKNSAVSDAVRAVGYLPSTLLEFSRAGIVKDIEARAYKGKKGVCWREPASIEPLAMIRPPVNTENPYFSLFTGQHNLCQVILDHLSKYPNARLFWNHSFCGLEDSENGVTSLFEVGPEKTKVEYKSKFLVAADGGRSAIRHHLGIKLSGYTWEDFRLVATNIFYDLGSFGWPEVNFIADPDNWGIALRADQNDQYWRVMFAMKTEALGNPDLLDEAALLSHARDKFRRMLPGNPDEAKIEVITSYTVHQRCAEKFVQGNVILSGDAAHLNCPIGALGLTTGILDAAALSRDLISIVNSGADSKNVLRNYEASRRDAFLSYTNPISTENIKRLFAMDEDSTKERSHHFKMINEMNMPYIIGMMKREGRISTTAGPPKQPTAA